MYWIALYVFLAIAFAALNAVESRKASYRFSTPDRLERARGVTQAMTVFAGVVLVAGWNVFDMRVPGIPGWLAALALCAYLFVAYWIGRFGAWSGMDRYRAELRERG